MVLFKIIPEHSKIKDSKLHLLSHVCPVVTITFSETILSHLNGPATFIKIKVYIITSFDSSRIFNFAYSTLRAICIHSMFTEFPVASRLSNINLIYRANSDHLPQYGLECIWTLQLKVFSSSSADHSHHLGFHQQHEP